MLFLYLGMNEDFVYLQNKNKINKETKNKNSIILHSPKSVKPEKYFYLSIFNL
jgi:hypothetical protein